MQARSDTSHFFSSPLRASSPHRHSKQQSMVLNALSSLRLPLLLICVVHHSEGGFFVANMSFPQDYPNKPPTVKFVSEMWHPNVYPDGKVCISILHSPGDDPMGYEQASERWSPVQTVETIMLSIISMLSSPNDESPANIDAAKQFREDFPGFRKRVASCVRKSQEM